MLFIGTFEHTIDTKLRLSIPSEWRDQYQPEADGDAFVLCLSEGPTLCLYTQKGFEKRAEELDHSELEPAEVLEYEQLLFSLARRVEMDKQGRIRLPEQLLKMVDLDKQVVMTGQKDHVQIHDRDRWQAYLEKTLATRPELLRNPRQLMRRSGQSKNDG